MIQFSYPDAKKRVDLNNVYNKGDIVFCILNEELLVTCGIITEIIENDTFAKINCISYIIDSSLFSGPKCWLFRHHEIFKPTNEEMLLIKLEL